MFQTVMDRIMVYSYEFGDTIALRFQEFLDEISNVNA